MKPEWPMKMLLWRASTGTWFASESNPGPWCATTIVSVIVYKADAAPQPVDADAIRQEERERVAAIFLHQAAKKMGGEAKPVEFIINALVAAIRRGEMM